jgi:hypothetical protein
VATEHRQLNTSCHSYVLDETNNSEILYVYFITDHDAIEQCIALGTSLTKTDELGKGSKKSCQVRGIVFIRPSAWPSLSHTQQNILLKDTALCNSSERYNLRQESQVFLWEQMTCRLGQPQRQDLPRHSRTRSIQVSIAFSLVPETYVSGTKDPSFTSRCEPGISGQTRQAC